MDNSELISTEPFPDMLPPKKKKKKERNWTMIQLVV